MHQFQKHLLKLGQYNQIRFLWKIRISFLYAVSFFLFFFNYSLNSKRRWGICREPETCSKNGDVYWPRDDKCYPKLTKGPCPRGELLTIGEDGIATCSCSITGELGRYYWPGSVGGCYEHYTKGPCTEPGELFLPGGVCGCHDKLPHYHESTGMCYQLGKLIDLK